MPTWGPSLSPGFHLTRQLGFKCAHPKRVRQNCVALLQLMKLRDITLQTLFVQVVTEFYLPAGGEGTQPPTM